MPSLHVPPSGLSLARSQDAARPAFDPVDVFGLTLSDSVIEDMIKCVRSGKTIQLSLGAEPKISYGTKIQYLSSTFDPFEHEYYRTALPHVSSLASSKSTSLNSKSIPYTAADLWGKARGPNFQVKTAPRVNSKSTAATKTATRPGEVLRRSTTTPDMSATSGTDAALAALKNSLASETARKKDNTSLYVKDTSNLPPAIQQRGSAKPIKTGNKARFLAGGAKHKSLGADTSRSMPSSPALSGVGSPSLPPTSIPLSQQLAEKAKTIRKPIVHRLALGSATEKELMEYRSDDITEEQFKSAIEKVAELENGQWKLKQKSFKDLDVFSYRRYSSQDRQIAIDNAIRAYDKMRLNASEPEWERLLPHQERGTGKCLSKLQAKIATGTIKPPKINVQHADDSGRDTPTHSYDKSDLHGEKKITEVKGGENMERSISQPPLMKTKRVGEKEAQTKRLLGKPGKKQALKAAEKKTAERESKKVKSTKYVNDSDEEDDYLIPPTSTTSEPIVTKTVTHSNVSMKTATKRARDDVDDSNSVIVTKKQKSTSPQKSSPLASSPPANASEISDSSLSSLNASRKRSADSSDAAPESKRHHKSSSISTTSSVASGNMSPARREMIIDKSKKFKVYYQKYAKLHKELSANSKRDSDMMDELLQMHKRLTEMKEEILKAAAS